MSYLRMVTVWLRNLMSYKGLIGKKYVVDEILIGARLVQKAIELDKKRFNVYGCLLFLQMLYFDSVETGFFRVEPTAFPRIAYYTGTALMVLIDEDTVVVDDTKIYGIMPEKHLDGGNTRYKGHLIYDKVHDWLRNKNNEFCDMLEEGGRIFYATSLADNFNTLLEIEMHEEEKRKMIISYKRDLKEYIWRKVQSHRQDLMKSILLHLASRLAGAQKSRDESSLELVSKTPLAAFVVGSSAYLGERSSDGARVGVEGVGMISDLNKPIGSTAGYVDLLSDQVLPEDRKQKRAEHEDGIDSSKEIIVYKPYTKGKRTRIEDTTDEEDYNVQFVDESIYRKCILLVHVPLSPFDVDWRYPAFDPEISEIGYQNLVYCSLAMRNRVWILHPEPSVLKLKVRHLLDILGPEGELNYVGMDLFTRVMVQIESGWSHPEDTARWRHPMNAGFVGAILHGVNPWDNRTINKMFVGGHISYDMEASRMILAPYMESEKNWVLYVFDTWLNKIHILDPMRSCEGVAGLRAHHHEKCVKLLDGYARCCNSFYDGLVVNKVEWKIKFHPGLNERASRSNSGFYVLHYMISFDGLGVEDKISNNDVHKVKVTVLQLVARIKRNGVTVPRCIYEPKWSDGK